MAPAKLKDAGLQDLTPWFLGSFANSCREPGAALATSFTALSGS